MSLINRLQIRDIEWGRQQTLHSPDVRWSLSLIASGLFRKGFITPTAAQFELGTQNTGLLCYGVYSVDGFITPTAVQAKLQCTTSRGIMR